MRITKDMNIKYEEHVMEQILDLEKRTLIMVLIMGKRTNCTIITYKY